MHSFLIRTVVRISQRSVPAKKRPGPSVGWLAMDRLSDRNGWSIGRDLRFEPRSNPGSKPIEPETERNGDLQVSRDLPGWRRYLRQDGPGGRSDGGEGVWGGSTTPPPSDAKISSISVPVPRAPGTRRDAGATVLVLVGTCFDPSKSTDVVAAEPLPFDLTWTVRSTDAIPYLETIRGAMGGEKDQGRRTTPPKYLPHNRIGDRVTKRGPTVGKGNMGGWTMDQDKGRGMEDMRGFVCAFEVHAASFEEERDGCPCVSCVPRIERDGRSNGMEEWLVPLPHTGNQQTASGSHPSHHAAFPRIHPPENTNHACLGSIAVSVEKATTCTTAAKCGRSRTA